MSAMSIKVNTDSTEETRTFILVQVEELGVVLIVLIVGISMERLLELLAGCEGS